MTQTRARPERASGPGGKPRPSRLQGAIAGAVGAAAALAVGQLPSALVGDTDSLIGAVGAEFVDRFAASLKDLAVALFGTNDKDALVIGIVLTSLAIGALAGVGSVRRRRVDLVAFGAFGLAGLWASVTAPQPRPVVAVVAATSAVASGVFVTRYLLLVAAREPREVLVDDADVPVRIVGRRAFLAWTAGAGAGAVLLGVGGAALRGRATAATGRAGVALPRAASRANVPSEVGLDIPGLSPYVTPNDRFYRIDTALITPKVAVDDWRLRVHGEVEEPFELGFDDLLAMDLVEEVVTLSCVSNEVGGKLVGNAVWTGVPLRSLLDRAGVTARGTQVIGRSVDGFTAGFPTSLVYDENRVALVAVGMNREPLPFAHGWPARLVVAGLYGYVSATKWLSEIELTSFDDVDGYWIPRGWAKEAPIKTQSRIDVPRAGGSLPPGTTPIAGVAWAPTRGIAKVEVQVDDGPWREATLGPAASGNTWVQWSLAWDAEAGEHTVRCRATDADGETQTSARTAPAPSGATGWHTRSVRVAS